VLLKDIEQIFLKELSDVMPLEEIKTAFAWLMEDYCGLARFALVMDPGYTVDKPTETLFFNALSQLKEGEPIQYVLGYASFLGDVYDLNRATLIPRPETEELVEWAALYLNERVAAGSIQHPPLHILDVGTGSGCIATQLAKQFPESVVKAIDYSPEALQMARVNADKLGVRVDFLQEDVLGEHWKHQTKYHLIVSNPPYVLESEAESMATRVKEYEPYAALFVSDEDPLIFYRAIALFAKQHLYPGGGLYFEINALKEAPLLSLLKEMGFTGIESKADFRGKARFIRAQIP